jgi:molybdate transport system ATP-binding protein
LQLGTPTELVSTPVDPFVASFTGALVLAGQALGTQNGLTKVVLDSGITAWSTDERTGPVNLAVYPWDVSLGPVTQDDSRMNHLSAPVTSIAPMGNRVRVHVGPVVAEITSASAARLDLRPGAIVTASFKATAARLFPR